MKQHRLPWVILGAITLLVASVWPTSSTTAQDGGAAATISALQTRVAVLTTQLAEVRTDGASLDTPTPATQENFSFGNGIFVVGTKVKPGTYRTRSASRGCYYARLSGFGGTLDEIISNNNSDDPIVITIDPTDKGFESARCSTWTSDLSRITKSTTQFGDGIYIVGTDVQPGTYSNGSASPGCYYARLSGFGGTLDEIISNNNTDSPAVVTIDSTDKGFESTRCGTWTLQS